MLNEPKKVIESHIKYGDGRAYVKFMESLEDKHWYQALKNRTVQCMHILLQGCALSP